MTGLLTSGQILLYRKIARQCWRPPRRGRPPIGGSNGARGRRNWKYSRAVWRRRLGVCVHRAGSAALPKYGTGVGTPHLELTEPISS
eukprot:841263-Prymnesium_polylepis.1